MSQNFRCILTTLCFAIIGILLTNNQFQQEIIAFASRLLNRPVDIEFRSIGLTFVGLSLLCCSVYFAMLCLSKRFFPSKSGFVRAYISVLLCLCFYGIVINYSISHMPIWDDYGVVLDYICNYTDSQNLSETLSILYEPHMESRFVFIKTIVLILFEINQFICIEPMIWLSAIAWIILFLIILKNFKPVNLKPMYILPIALIMFQFEFYDAIVWGTSAMQYNFVLLFACISFLFALKESYFSLIYAFLFSIIGAFTFGNGLLIILVLCFLFGIQKRWGALVAGIAISIVLYYVYFLKHQESSLDITLLVRNAYQYPAYILTFLGSSIQWMYNKWISFSVGLFLACLFVWLIRQHYFLKNKLIFLLLCFIIASAFMAAVLRLKVENFDQALASRYGIFSALFIALLFIAYAELGYISISGLKKFIYIALILNISAGFFYYPEVLIRKNKLERFAYNWFEWHIGKSEDLIIPDKTGLTMASGGRLSRAYEKKIFFPVKY